MHKKSGAFPDVIRRSTFERTSRESARQIVTFARTRGYFIEGDRCFRRRSTTCGPRDSLDESSEWSRWLSKHKGSLRSIHMLTASRFVQLTANFVRNFAELGELMRIDTEPAAFDAELESAIARARR